MNPCLVLSTATLLAIMDLGYGQGRGCVTVKEGDQTFSKKINIPEKKWIETPSVVTKAKDRYQVFGRVVHMDFVQEHLATKKNVNFRKKQSQPNNIELEVQADTVYIEGVIKMRGIKKLTMFSRKIVSGKNSQLDLRAPELKQTVKTQAPGDDGQPGRNGAPGPTVELFAKVSHGYLYITTNGGNGNEGQAGANGRKGTDDDTTKPPKTFAQCKANKCTSIGGAPGQKGPDGGNGGNAGKSGNGGDAGQQTFYVARIFGKIELKTCPGQGARAANNGIGGEGGLGSHGGSGMSCKYEKQCTSYLGGVVSCTTYCKELGAIANPTRGEQGDKGADGTAPMVDGSNGQVENTYVRKLDLSNSAKNRYPLTLLKLMKRYAEDRIWANDLKEGKRVLGFLVALPKDREDTTSLRKDAERRLGFLDKDEFDRFGNNKLFAPIMRWEELKRNAEKIVEYADPYETAYNSIQSLVKQQKELKTVVKEMVWKTANRQVLNERNRMKEAKRVATTQKELYRLSIEQLEKRMNSNLETVMAMVEDVQSKFSMQHLFAILKSMTGFVTSVGGKSPGGILDSSLSFIETFATQCNKGTLQENKGKLQKWMTFGEQYDALTDSSDLNFDTMEVQEVPEIMKANLELNKEGLAADLVCLLEERLAAHQTARFKEEIERFFINGATRIDLISRIMDLDNDIGTYNFDISNLRETANQIRTIGKSKGSPITDNIQQTFLDNLLTSYEKMETSFAKQLYKAYKGFEFRSLWNVGEKMESFQQRAVNAAKGTGRLNGVLTLKKALYEIEQIENKARSCFTKIHHKTWIHKWPFDSVKNPGMFEELHKDGQTTFTLDISKACKDCYNVRLLKIYVELNGDTPQAESVPDAVRLKLRPEGRSYFRDGTGKVRVFHQALADTSSKYNWRYLTYDRFKMTDDAKCREAKGSFYCMTVNDPFKRLEPMCCHPLANDSPCTDPLEGAEECRSVFGTYTITIPIDPELSCDAQIGYKNCKDLNRKLFTRMNVWTTYMYWPESYPTGPDDDDCVASKRNATSAAHIPMSKPLSTLKNEPN
ncbi:uncharacterized protein LOC144665665 [Oculina patagonica]